MVVGGWPYLPVGITYSNGWNVWRVTTNDIQRVSSGGEYQVESWHFAEAPWGYEPRVPVCGALVIGGTSSVSQEGAVPDREQILHPSPPDGESV